MNKFVIVVEQPNGRAFMVTDDEEGLVPSRFTTAKAARACAEDAAWARAWVWWVAELECGGMVQFGPDAI